MRMEIELQVRPMDGSVGHFEIVRVFMLVLKAQSGHNLLYN